ncbi:hypothetical protein Btru_074129 [Bulinus truncatus]|nr:hypothetical protein Btru_074129 [Bulinus truncatus]
MREMLKVVLPTMMAIIAYGNEILVSDSIAEEGKPFTIMINGVLLNDISLELYLLKGTELLVFCYLPDPCDVIYDKQYNVTTDVYQSNVTVHVTIFNVTREGIWSSEGEWTVKTVDKNNRKKEQRFELTIFDLGDDFQCHQINNVHPTFISCNISKMYPSAKCQLIVKMQEEIIANTSHFIYSYDELPEYSKSFSFKCLAEIPLLFSGDYIAMVTVYPNLTGRRDDIKYGIKSFFNVSIDSLPVVLENCPKVIQEGTEVSCNCKNSKSNNLFLNWLDISDHVISDSGVLTFTADRAHQVYSCQAVNEHGIKSPKLLYMPKVINTKISKTKCSYTFEEKIEVTCSIDKIYPSPICSFDLNSNKSVEFDSLNIKYEHSSHLDDSFFFNSKCMISVSVNFFEPGLYILIVTVYPNVSGSYTDKVFGLNTTFLYFHDDVSYQETTESNLHYLAPVVVAGAGIIICLMFSAVCLFRLRRMKKATRQRSEVVHVYDSLIGEKETSVYMNVKLNTG